MAEPFIAYAKNLPECDWDGLVRTHTVGRVINPGAGLRLELPAQSADELVRILRDRDRVRVVEIEAKAEPRFFHAAVLALLACAVLQNMVLLALAVLA